MYVYVHIRGLRKLAPFGLRLSLSRGFDQEAEKKMVKLYFLNAKSKQ